MAASASQPPGTTPASPAPAAAAAAERPAGTRALLLRHGPLLVLFGWTALMTALLAHFSVGNHVVFIDESNAVVLGRFIEGDLGQAFTGTVARGPERLTSWMAAVAAAFTSDPAGQFELLHFVTSLAQALVVVPIWLAGRELGLGRWTALVPATIASAGSFAFYGVLTLNTTVGTLSCALMLWAMLRALRRPGLLSDVLVVATLGLTVIARIGWAPLVGALAPAVLATLWFGRPAGERLTAWLRALPLRLLRQHPLLSLGAVALLLALLVVGTDPFVGGSMYGGVRLHPSLEPSVLWDNTRVLASHLALGTAFVPFVLALPLVVRSLWRPPDAVEGGFAWLVLAYVLIFSYAYYFSMNEDRYFAVLAAPFVLAGALAVFKRPPPLWSIALSGVAVTVLVATSYESPVGDVYRYFIAPTSVFFGDVIVGKLSTRISASRELLAFVTLAVAAAVAFALAFVTRSSIDRRLRIGAGALVLAGLLAFQLATTYHPANEFLTVVGLRGVPEQQLEFVDEAVDSIDGSTPFGAAEPLAIDGIVHPDLAAQMPSLQVFNKSLGYRFSVAVDDGDGVAPIGAQQATIDWRSGAVRSEAPVPAVLVTAAGQSTVGLDGEQLASPPLFAWAGMQHPVSPLRVEWLMRGALPDRFADPATPLQVRVFPHGSQQCLTGLVNAHPLGDRAVVHYRLGGGLRPVRGTVGPGQPRPFSVRVAATRPTTLTLRGDAGRITDGTRRAPSLFNLELASCRR